MKYGSFYNVANIDLDPCNFSKAGVNKIWWCSGNFVAGFSVGSIYRCGHPTTTYFSVSSVLIKACHLRL